jgi:hypothetical protein
LTDALQTDALQTDALQTGAVASMARPPRAEFENGPNMDTEYGPTLYADAFEPPFDRVVEEVVEDGRLLHKSLTAHMKAHWKARPLEILVVDNAGLNACAIDKGSSDRILIFRGTFEHLYGATLGLLSTPTFLPCIGKVTDEVLPQSLPDDSFPPVPLLRDCSEADASTHLFFPNDQTRTTVAVLMADLALRFLMFHEIGHVVGGHFEMQRAGAEVRAITEFQCDPGDRGDVPLAQIRECDADAFACHATASIHIHDRAAALLSELLGGGESQSNNYALLTYVAAVGVLFRVLYPTAPRKISECKSSHPHPAVRSCIVASSTMARGLYKGSFSLDLLDRVVAESVGGIEEVWTTLCLSRQNPEEPNQWSKSVCDSAMSLFSSYGQSRALFEQYARLPRAWDDWDWGESGVVDPSLP